MPVSIQHLLPETSNPLIKYLPVVSFPPHALPISSVLLKVEQAPAQAREEADCLIIQHLLILNMVPLINIKP